MEHYGSVIIRLAIDRIYCDNEWNFPNVFRTRWIGFPIFVDFSSILNISMKRLLGIMMVSLMLSFKEVQNMFDLLVKVYSQVSDILIYFNP